MKRPEKTIQQDSLYQQAVAAFGRDIGRFAAGYERDPGRRKDLLQEVHLALWRSFASFQGQCSLRTWVYRVAHNAGVNHIQRSKRAPEQGCTSLDDIELQIDASADIVLTDQRLDLQRVMAIVHSLSPLDRELMLLYLEDLDAASIGDITGLSARNVATKIHRIKQFLINQLGNKEQSS